MARDINQTSLERAEEIVNSIKFQISLWKKVKLAVEEDGTKKVINAEYWDHPLFPSIMVKGYNPYSKTEEEYRLLCYTVISDWSSSDWEKEYEETGYSPAYSFPEEVKGLIFCHISNLEMDLKNAKERLKAEKELASQPKDTATYYMLGDSLIGKRDKKKDYFFLDAKWIPDEEGFIGKLLNGEDITDFESEWFAPETLEIINSIEVVEREQAMEVITDQTIRHLLMEWSEKFAEQKTDWDKHPQWFSKWVSIDIKLNGIERTLYPKDFVFADGAPADAFIESISDEIREDVRKAGGYVTNISGMID